MHTLGRNGRKVEKVVTKSAVLRSLHYILDALKRFPCSSLPPAHLWSYVVHHVDFPTLDIRH